MTIPVVPASGLQTLDQIDAANPVVLYAGLPLLRPAQGIWPNPFTERRTSMRHKCGQFYVFLSFILAACLVTTGLPAMAVTTGSDALGLHWLSEITEEAVEAEYDGPDAGKLGPYLQQLAKVRQGARVGDRSAIVNGMNKYLSMLVSKENGISGKTAVRLFDTAYELVPARYVDAQRFKKQYDVDMKADRERFALEHLGDRGIR